jgi:hypothetical protein
VAVFTQVTGSAKLAEVEVRLARSGPEFDKAVAKQMRTVPPKVMRAVREQVPTHLPSGYAPVLEKSLRYRSTVSTKNGLTMQIWAVGKTRRRDLPAMNKGRLKHPLFGNRKKWFTTTARPRLIEDAVDHSADAAADALRKARDEAAHSVTKG